MKTEDEFVRLRKLVVRRHLAAQKKIVKASAKHLQTGMRSDMEDQIRAEGEKQGLCFALKAIDKACQIDAFDV